MDTYDDGVKLINDNPYGNGTAIFTNDGGAARQFQNEVKVGMIGINVPVPVPMAYYSFGGWKSSLFGDSHAHGMEGVHFFTRGKVVTSRWLDPSHGAEPGLPPERLTRLNERGVQRSRWRPAARWHRPVTGYYRDGSCTCGPASRRSIWSAPSSPRSSSPTSAASATT